MKSYKTRENAVKAADKILENVNAWGNVDYVIVSLDDGRFAVLLGATDSGTVCHLASKAPVIHGSFPLCLR